MFRMSVFAAFFLFLAHAVQAATFNINIPFTTGPAAGTFGTGTLTLDGFTGVGVETFAPVNNTALTSGLVTGLSVTAGGQTFTLANSLGGVNDPLIGFYNGVLQTFVFSASGIGTSLFISSNQPPSVVVDLRTGANEISLGTLSLSQVPAVPLPATGLMLTGALALLAFGRIHSSRPPGNR